MPKNEPNEAARGLLVKAAAEMGAIAKIHSEVSSLWSQVAEHLLAGRLAEADEIRYSARVRETDVELPRRRAGDYVDALRLVDSEWASDQLDRMEKNAEKIMDGLIAKIAGAAVSAMTPAEAGRQLEAHERKCPERDCPTSKLLRARSIEKA